ncbi:MAG: type II toxin-antitoxin system VapC family toxin [Anaerolineales bacterium]|nr:type II toxin-antitoxin system VapC family toxin [Anaerolineales bacterium]
MPKVIDTDILIDHFHRVPQATDFIQSELLTGETLIISAVTVAEVLAGVRPGEEEATEALLSLFQALAIDETIARIAGGYLNRYSRTNRIDLGDALVAATARATGSALFTCNVRHYPMPDISVVVPYRRGQA